MADPLPTPDSRPPRTPSAPTGHYAGLWRRLVRSVPVEPGQDAWSVAWRQYRKNRLAMWALAVVVLLFGLACFAPLLANGRPLWLRGHLTHVYESDVAAFRDWHERLGLVAGELRAGLGGDEQTVALRNARLYQEGLPRILLRLEEALAPDEARALAEARARYRALVAVEPADLDLAAHAALGEEIEAKFGALSVGAAYKRAATPLLRVPDLSEAWDVARAEPEGAEAKALQVRAREIAARSRAGVEPLLAFLAPAERVAVSAAWEPAREALDGLSAHTDLPELRARVAALERALDRAAALPVDPALQRLPMQTRWPALAYLSPAEVGFLVLYVTALLCLGLRRAVAELSPRGRALLVLGPALVAAGVWKAAVPDVLPPSESLYKRFAAELAAHPDGSAGAAVFPLVPFGENENIYADRVAPPIIWERVELAAWESATHDGGAPSEDRPLPSLIRRLREPGEELINASTARERLGRLRSHWLGTDANGRDVLARLVIGSRVSLSVGFVAVAIYATIGVILGALGGYFRGWADLALGRLIEVVDCFPTLFLIISLMALLPRPSIFYIMVIIGLTHWTGVARLTRGEFLRIGGLDFVAAARALGLSPLRVVFRHMLPNALGPVLVTAAFGVAGAILIESALSFLGFGVPAPQASWGSVLHDARGNEKALWWVTVFPGVLIFLTVTAYNLVGEGLRDALDPRLRR